MPKTTKWSVILISPWILYSHGEIISKNDQGTLPSSGGLSSGIIHNTKYIEMPLKARYCRTYLGVY